MRAVLQQEGVGCSKTAGEEGTWDLSVPSDDFSKSVETLKALGYPKESTEGLSEMFKGGGMVPSPTEVKCMP